MCISLNESSIKILLKNLNKKICCVYIKTLFIHLCEICTFIPQLDACEAVDNDVDGKCGNNIRGK